jgi:hypothetical protein
VGLEQAIAQQLLGVWLGTQLERCFWNNFLEVPNCEANPKRSSSPWKAHKVSLIIVAIIHAATCARPLLAIATMGQDLLGARFVGSWSSCRRA